MNMQAITLALVFAIQSLTQTTASFRVRVVDQLHCGIGKVWVNFPSLGRSEVLLSDDTGIVTIPNLPVGTVNVQVSAPGFRASTLTLPVTGNQERPLLLTLRLGAVGCDPHYAVDYSNQPGLTQLRGLVSSDRGKKLRSIRFEWWEPGQKTPVAIVFSNKRGEFEVSQIAPGAYTATVNAETKNKKYEVLKVPVVIKQDELAFITINLKRKGWIQICE